MQFLSYYQSTLFSKYTSLQLYNRTLIAGPSETVGFVFPQIKMTIKILGKTELHTNGFCQDQ